MIGTFGLAFVSAHVLSLWNILVCDEAFVCFYIDILKLLQLQSWYIVKNLNFTLTYKVNIKTSLLD